MSQTPDPKEKYAKLIQQLLDQKIISAPQADIARADAEVTGMGLDEVLVARRWVSEETLHKVAPWLKNAIPRVHTDGQKVEPGLEKAQRTSATSLPAVAAPSNGNEDFDENLRKYRELMEKILGEANS
ncbi:MAG TPA: hypothetical protein V6C81_17995 [Planktothrix sp.]